MDDRTTLFLRVVVCLLALVVGSPSTIGAQDAGGPPVLPDVEAAFARIQTHGEHLRACANGVIPEPRYRTTSVSNFFGLRNHFQGIQRLPRPGYLALSGSNSRSADLFIVRLARDEDPEGCDHDGEVVAHVSLDNVMRHAGGMSVLGSILAIPLHGGSPRHAKVVFYDVAEPESPRRLGVEIARPGRKASAAALTRLPNGHVLVAVLSAYDGLPRRVDFYLSRTTTLNDGFAPEPATWRVSDVEARHDQDPTFSHFQAVGFIRQADGRLYLVGFHNSVAPQAIFPGRDYADLYEVVFPEEMIQGASPRLSKPRVIKAANRMLHCKGGFCNLDAAAGLFVDPATLSMSVYATPGWLDGDTIKVTVF
jgi:hypothetical protein